jgi:uncharacterized protein (TIGR00730 family)
MALSRVCVFCGSSFGARPEFESQAQALGRSIAARGLGLVYGGGHVGLMGVVADAAQNAGALVTGIIPEALMAREVAHPTLGELIVTANMHERKARMAERADAFLALPGGLGTLEELFEVWTWAQLGLHDKPLGLLNVAGYYDGLLAFLQQMVEQRFVRTAELSRLLVDADPDRLLERLADASESSAGRPPELAGS